MFSGLRMRLMTKNSQICLMSGQTKKNLLHSLGTSAGKIFCNIARVAGRCDFHYVDRSPQGERKRFSSGENFSKQQAAINQT